MPEITLLNVDCMEYMKTLKDGAFDLAIVDPPYGIKESAHRNISRTKLARTKNYKKEIWDMKIPEETYFAELFRVSKNQIIWGGNYYLDFLQSTRCFIVWDKENGDNHFADCELAWSSFSTGVRKFKFKWQGMLQEKMGDQKENRIHPTQKPAALYRWLLHNYAQPGQRILDTHLGSGSSAIAAHQMGFDFVGCEIDKDYYDAACKRFKEQTAQQSLFQ